MAKDAQTKRFLKKFGLKMRGLRDKKGWTLETAEEHGGPNWTHLQRIEAGNKNISLSTALRLSKLYRISLSELFEDI